MIEAREKIDRRGARTRAVMTLAVAAVSATLAGCNHATEVAQNIPSDYRHRHPIVINEGNQTVELFVGSKRGGLTAAQRADVLAFAQAWKRESSGGIIIDMPAGTSNERAAAESLSEINAILAAAGTPPNGVYVRPYRPADPRALATVRLHYPKMAAEAGPCGMWPEDLGPVMDTGYRDNRPHWNHGCATQRNLAAMVDNPADLVQPRGEAPVYTARRTIVLDRYRQGQNSATNYPANQGRISDIGR